MPKQSAGLLLYRNTGHGVEVFLVHPGGPFWAKKDDGAWSIPKGEFADGENALEAAKREFREETGYQIIGHFEPLEPVKQPGGKMVHAWCIEADLDLVRNQAPQKVGGAAHGVGHDQLDDPVRIARLRGSVRRNQRCLPADNSSADSSAHRLLRGCP